MANASNGAPERNVQRRRALGVALLVVGAAAAAGVVGVAMSATSAGASAPPSVVVDPGTGLIDGQVLTVTWHDFAPGASVVLRQCSQAPVSAADCSKLLQSEPSDDSGSGSTTFPVVVTNGSDRQLAGAPNVACDASSPCSVYVLPDATPDSLGQGAKAAISFAKPTSGCPSPGARSVSAEGTDAVGRALTAWRPVLCEKPDLTSVDYVPKNDPSGRQDFLCGLRDIAIISGGPLAGEVCNGSGQGRSAPVVLPIAASALSFGYNIHDQKTGRRILDLKLTPSLLAQIFTGQVLRWNDPRVAALNPGYNLPTKLRVVGRADASELNRQLTTFFWTAARSAYQGGGPAFADGPTDTYASIPGIDLRTGGDAVAAALASPSDNNPRDDPSYGYIGVVDSSVAAFWGLPSAAIQSADESRFVAPTDASISASISSLSATSDLNKPLIDPASDPRGYRLPVISNVLVPTDKVGANQVDAIKRFLTYSVGPGQADGTLPRGYVQLPAALASRTLAAANALVIPAPAPTASTPAAPTATKPVTPSGNAPASSFVGDGTGTTVGSDNPAAADAASAAAPPGTITVAAGVPIKITSVFARSGLDDAGPAPWLLPILAVAAVGALVLGQRLLRVPGPKKRP